LRSQEGRIPPGNSLTRGEIVHRCFTGRRKSSFTFNGGKKGFAGKRRRSRGEGSLRDHASVHREERPLERGFY